MIGTPPSDNAGLQLIEKESFDNNRIRILIGVLGKSIGKLQEPFSNLVQANVSVCSL